MSEREREREKEEEFTGVPETTNENDTNRDDDCFISKKNETSHMAKGNSVRIFVSARLLSFISLVSKLPGCT